MVRYSIKHAVCVIMVSGSVVSSMSAMQRSVSSTQLAQSQSNHFRNLTVKTLAMEEGSLGGSSLHADESAPIVRHNPLVASGSLSANDDQSIGKAKPKNAFLMSLVKRAGTKCHEINQAIKEFDLDTSPVQSRPASPISVRDNRSGSIDLSNSPITPGSPVIDIHLKNNTPVLNTNLAKTSSNDKQNGAE